MEQMTFEEFNRLADGDRVPLVLGLEILLQNGRRLIQGEDSLELVSAGSTSMKSFFAEAEIRKIAEVCRKLAALETNVLVDYIRRGNLEMKAPGAEEAGVCPVCGGELEYEDDIRTDDGGFFLWKCPSCGATGKEGYDKTFDRHYDVTDGDGKPYPPAE